MKKNLTLLLLLTSLISIAQIKGNKEITTKNYTISDIKHVKINLYAEVIIDQSMKEGITITTDANLFDLIEKEVVDGILYLDQKEWIQPSQNAKIIIGAPNLQKVESGTNDTTRIINLNNESIQVLAPVGKVFVSGKTNELRIAAEVATVDASDLIAKNARVDIWSWGTARVNVTDELDSKLSENATLVLINTPKKIKGDAKKIANKKHTPKDNYTEYIKFKIKNNSLNRNQFFVIGPKPDGSRFSYGFPMMPQTTRKENWTTGTKVYKVNKLGLRKLLITIKKEDENSTVSLF